MIWVAVAVASLKGAVSAGPGRNKTKSECRWIASRWQLADCLTKAGLGKALRMILTTSTTKLHELSLQALKKFGSNATTTTSKNKRKTSSKVSHSHMVNICATGECCQSFSLFSHATKITIVIAQGRGALELDFGDFPWQDPVRVPGSLLFSQTASAAMPNGRHRDLPDQDNRDRTPVSRRRRTHRQERERVEVNLQSHRQ